MELMLAFQKAGVSLALGLLVGLQRERSASALAGIRTFPLITLFGTVMAFMALPNAAGASIGGWLVAAGALAVAATLALGNVAKLKAGEADPGITTEMAALLMYGVGAYLVVGHTSLAVAVGGAVALLLHWKEPLHDWVRRIGDRDVRAMMQFVLIALVVLPVLPDKEYGPLKVLNPREIWLVVVLIVGISLGGYIAFKFFGAKAGGLLGGILGGVISSTAATVSYARRTKETEGEAEDGEGEAKDPQSTGNPKSSGVRAGAGLAALVILIASTVAFIRVIVEVAIVAPRVVAFIAPPLAAMLLFMAGLSAAIYFRERKTPASLPEPKNPAELKAALIFGLLYAFVLLLVAAAKKYLGDRALYAVAVVSGLTDMDAITLSTAQLVNHNALTPHVGWRLILIASLSNLVFKFGIVATLGTPRLRNRMAVLFGLSIVAGLVVLFIWPDRLNAWIAGRLGSM